MKSPKRNMQQPQENFKAANPVFDPRPIPEEFKFPQFDLYIQKLHWDIAVDENFVMKQLVPHFEDVVNTLTPAMNEMYSKYKQLKAQFDSASDPQPRKEGLNYLNEHLFRKYQVLDTLAHNAWQTWLASRLAILQQRSELLSYIKNVAYYLAEHPNYYYINIRHADQSWRAIEFDYITEVLREYQALQRAKEDIEIQMKFIPHAFSNVDSNIKVIEKVIDESLKLFDDKINYCPETEGYEKFYYLLLSRRFPAKIKGVKLPQHGPYTKVTKYLTKGITEYMKLSSSEVSKHNIIMHLVTRIFFDQYLLSEVDRAVSTKFNAKMEEFKEKTVGDLVPFFSKEKSALTPMELLNKSVPLKSASSMLDQIMFLRNPIDILFYIYRIHNILLDIIRGVGGDCTNTNNIRYMWGLLFVVSSQSDIVGCFKYAEKWLEIPIMSSTFKEVFQNPISFINKFM